MCIQFTTRNGQVSFFNYSGRGQVAGVTTNTNVYTFHLINKKTQRECFKSRNNEKRKSQDKIVKLIS